MSRVRYNATQLKANFQNIRQKYKESKYLFPKNFNSVSPLSTQVYVQTLKINWREILEDYEEYNNMYEYLKQQYIKFVSITNKRSLQLFAKSNNLTYEFLQLVGTDQLKKDCNIQKLRYTDEDYKINFFNIKQVIGKVPLYNEFTRATKIAIESYAERFNFKGVVYNNIIKKYCTIKEYQEYLQRSTEHKRKVGTITGALSTKYSVEDLKIEFCRVFDDFFKQYGTYPSRRLFNKFSKHDDSVYRRRLHMTWTQICKYYNYNVQHKNISETVVLNMISQILHSDYIPQKTWDWLIGIGGKNMYCDGYFEAFKLVVEFDGKQHRTPINSFGGVKSFQRLQQNDKLKNQLLIAHGYKIIRIDSRYKWYEYDFLTNILIKNNIIKDNLKEVV